ncbi:glucagon receptor isoform X9 [Equus quagga]|nr:glucagon receptor isoform X9 [Equus quagga]XP_046531995.1 glucagon receptor isoform X9 [Equus quagga]
MPPIWPRRPHLLLLLLLLACQPQAPSAQVMDFLFEKWKLYGDQCLHNLSLLPPPTELVCNRTFDKYSCWPDTPPNTTANISCPWYLPWHHKAPPRLQEVWAGRAVGAWAPGATVAKCLPVPDGRQGDRGPGQPTGALQGLAGWGWVRRPRPALTGHCNLQKEVAKMYNSFQVMYTVGYSLSLGALLLALAILLGLSKLHCTRNYIHMNLFVSFVLKASSVLVIDTLLETRYSQKIGDDLSVSIWLSDEAVAGCRVAAVFMQYGIVANYCWLLVEGVYLHSLLGLATFPERSFFTLYLSIGWGAPMLFVIPWAVVKCLFENIQCWTSNDNMGFWWILRFPVFLAILINFFIFIRIIHILLAKLRAHQMRYTDYKFRACWWLFSTVSSTRRCSRSCCVAGIAGAWVRPCRRSATWGATRPQPGPPAAPPARSYCSPGVAAAMGPARTPQQRPTWPAASLGWLSAPSDVPWNPSWGWTQVLREGIARKSRTGCPTEAAGVGARQQPHRPRVPQGGGLRGRASPPHTCTVPGWGTECCRGTSCSSNACLRVPVCVGVSSIQGNVCPPTIKSSSSGRCAHPGELGCRRGAGWAQGLHVGKEQCGWGLVLVCCLWEAPFYR